MITMRGASVMIAAALSASVTLTVPAQAFDLNGAWASSPENCAKIFTRKGSQIAFSDNSDIYGGGFIVAGNRIVGKTGQCRIKARKEDGKQIHLISECASDIMYQNMQLSLTIVDPDTVIRIFPGLDDMQMSFGRCPAL